MPILIITGGAIITPEDEIIPQPEEDMIIRQALCRPRKRRFLGRLPTYSRSLEPNPVIVEPTDCPYLTTDLYFCTLGIGYPLNRPIGSGATFLPTSNARHQNWAQASGVTINQVKDGFAWPTYNATGSPIVTITYGGNPNDNAAKNFPAVVPMPNNVDLGTNPSGDNALLLYDGASQVWHSFWKLNLSTKKALAHHAHPADQESLSPRGTSASGLVDVGHLLRRQDWVVARQCTKSLGIAVGSKTKSPYLHPVAILSPEIVWPATARDNSGDENQGQNPYGTWLALPPNITKASLGIVDTPNMMQHTAFDQAREHGWLLVDQAKSGNAVFRADQGWTSAEINECVTALNKIRPALRIISNVGANGSNPIGGGTPLGPNCGNNRVVTVIKSVDWWRGRYSLSNDLNQVINNDFIPGTTTRRGWDDSWKHYEKAFSFGGNTRMWQATGDDIYLDRVLLYVEGVIDAARISSSLGPNGFGDNFLGWLGKTHPSNPDQEAPLYEFYCWRWIVIMLEESYRRGMMTSGPYATRLQAIQDFFEQHVFTKWWTRGVNSHIYRVVMHISSHAAILCLFLKNRGSTSTIRSRASTILDNIDHLGQPNYGGPYNNLRSMFVDHPYAPSPSTTAFWNAYFKAPPPPNTVPSYDTTNGSDTSHSEAVVVYIDFAIQMGYGSWVVNDITKIINMWNFVWSGNTHYAWLRGPTATPAAGIGLTWTPNYNEFFCSAGYSKSQQIKMETFSGSNSTLYFGQGAYNAKRLG